MIEIDYNSLISAIVGGLIAIVPAYLIEKHKRIKERQIKGADEVLIPLGTKLENIIEQFNKVEIGTLYSFNISNLVEQLKIYLSFDKRFFLGKELFIKLTKVIEFADEIDRGLEFEYENLMKEYREFLITYLDDFDYGEYIGIGFLPTTETYVKKMILKKDIKTLRKHIEIVEFVYIDEPEKRKSKKIKCGSSEMLEYSGIQCGYIDEEDLSQDSIDLIEFFIKEIEPNEKNKVVELIANTKSNEKAKEFLKALYDLKTAVVNCIEIY